MATIDDSYAEIAPWYDLEHDPITEDIECFAELLGTLGQQLSVLEVGSGTGRVAAGLAMAGCRVTGVEPSAAMRARCIERLAQLPERVARRVRVLAGSVGALDLDQAALFDATIFSLNTFAHLVTLQERLDALAQVYSHLRPGSQLFIDLDIAGPRRLSETAGQLWWQGTWQIPDSVEQVSHFVTAAAGHRAGVLDLVHFYDVGASGGSLRRTIARMSLALLTPGEIELALRLSGFELAAVYGSYDLASYEDSTGHALIVAQR